LRGAQRLWAGRADREHERAADGMAVERDHAPAERVRTLADSERSHARTLQKKSCKPAAPNFVGSLIPAPPSDLRIPSRALPFVLSR
jgi:hypothetical protein